MAVGTGSNSGLPTKIPEGANPYRAIVNGVEHAYEAGEETEVAPGVAELINAADNFPPAAEEVKPPFAGGGGGGGVLVVHVIRTATDEDETYTLDKTWQELADALNSGKSLSFVEWESNENIGLYFTWSISNLIVEIRSTSGKLTLETDSPDGYPTATVVGP